MVGRTTPLVGATGIPSISRVVRKSMKFIHDMSCIKILSSNKNMWDSSTEKVRAVIYTRVSTLGQKNDGFGLEMQLEECTNCIVYHKWTLIREYSDQGISGALGISKRPALKQLIEDAQANKFDVIVAYSLDRIGRTTRLIIDILDDLRKLGIRYKTVRENIDTISPAGTMLLAVFAGLAQFERESIQKRTTDGRNIRKNIDGDIGGVLKFGYERIKIDEKPGSKIIIQNREAYIIRVIFHCRDNLAYTYKQIVDLLNANNYYTRRNKPWGHSSIIDIYKKNKDAYNGGTRGDSVYTWPIILDTSIPPPILPGEASILVGDDDTI